MEYINSSTLIISNSPRHCLEAFDVTTVKMKTYAGVCGTSGSRLTGHRIDNVRLSSALGVVFDGSHMIYSSSNGQRKIFGINVTSDIVHEVCGTDGMAVKSFVFGESPRTLLVVLNHAVGTVDISTGEFTVLSGSLTSGDSIGDLRTTEYYYPSDILRVNESTLLVSDARNNRYVCKELCHPVWFR